MRRSFIDGVDVNGEIRALKVRRSFIDGVDVNGEMGL